MNQKKGNRNHFLHHQLYLLNLSWKNLTRYTRRTLITAGAIAFGIMLYLYVDSMLVGAELDSERNLLWYETGWAQILDSQYWEKKVQMPLKHRVEEAQEISAWLEQKNIPYTKRIVFSVEAIFHKDPFPQEGSQRVIVYGIDVDTDNEVYRFEETLVEGEYLTKGQEGLLIGSWLAEDIGAQVGYPLTLSTRTKDGMMQTIDMTIKGIIKCPNPNVNRTALFMNLEDADYYLDMEGAVTNISLNLGSIEGAPQRADELSQHLKDHWDVEILDWKELGRDFVAMSEAKKGGSKIYLFMVFIIAAIGISNTMLMAIFERQKEIGMMRAMGMKDGDIINCFAYEASGIGLLGSLVGILMFIPLNIHLTQFGIDFSTFMRDTAMGYRSVVFMGTWSIPTIVGALIAGTAMAVIFAIIPARKAIKMVISDSLRDQ